MATRRERIEKLLGEFPGMTDREITDQLEGHSAPQQPFNVMCRKMESQKILARRKRRDGLIGNYLVTGNLQKPTSEEPKINSQTLPPESLVKYKSDLPKKNSLQVITDLGFEDAGYWFKDGENISYSLDKYTKEINILYAFVVNGEVKYIGKSVQTFYKRMYLYKQGGGSQLTNIRNRKEIKTCLDKGMSVRIYVFVQKIPMDYKGMPINLAAGLEDNLIILLKPEWNKR